MKIILANRYFHPDQSATSRMVSSLAFSLAEQGLDVAVLTGRHLHNRRDVLLPTRETVRGVAVNRVRTTGFGRGGMAGRATDYATFHLAATAWWLLNAGKGDLCVFCTDPPFLGASSAVPVALRGARSANWIMDLFPETAMELGMMDEGGIAGRFALLLRDWSLARSDLTICPTASMARYIETTVGGSPRVAVVHHWADGREIRPVPRSGNRLRREWGLQDAFVVGYSGNFGRAHEFATLLDAAEELLRAPDIRFLMIGEGQQRGFVEAEARRRGLTNILFRPFQPSEILSESLGVSDVHVVSLLPSLEHCIVPSKFYGVLAAGRPTIFVGAHDGEVATACRRARCGETVAPGDAAGLVDVVLALKADPARTAAMGARARALMESDFSQARGVKAWLQAVSSIPTQDRSGVAPVADEALK